MKSTSHTAALASVVLAGVVIFGTTSCSSEPAPPAGDNAASTADTGSASAEQDEDAAESEASQPETSQAGTDGGGTLNVSEQNECVTGNWYPKMDEFTELRAAGLGGSVESLTGSIMVSMTADGTMTTNYDELHYLISSPGVTIETSRSGMVSAEFIVAPEGTTRVRGTIEDNTEVESIMTKDGAQDVSSSLSPPIVFDRFTLACSGDEMTLTNPFGSLTMVREH